MVDDARERPWRGSAAAALAEVTVGRTDAGVVAGRPRSKRECLCARRSPSRPIKKKKKKVGKRLRDEGGGGGKNIASYELRLTR